MTAVRLMYFLGALVVGVAWVPALSFLDTHGSADLLWAIGLFALGEILVAISRARIMDAHFASWGSRDQATPERAESAPSQGLV